MAIDVLAMLAQAAGLPGASANGRPLEEEATDIVVTGQQQPEPTPDPPVSPPTQGVVTPEPPFSLRATPRISREPSTGEGEALGSGRRSVIGAKGRFRDILGTIGDALLMYNDKDPRYAPQREQEVLQDAMQLFQANPQEGLRAVASVNPKMAAQLQEQMQQNELKKLQAESLNDYRQAQGEAAQSRIKTAEDRLAFDREKWGVMEENYRSQIQKRDADIARLQGMLEVARQNAASNASRAGSSASQAGTAAERAAWDRSPDNPKNQPKSPRGIKTPRSKEQTAPSAPTNSGAASGGNRKVLPDGRIATYKGSGDRKDSRNWTIQ